MKLLITFISGVIFSLGLGVSGMTQPHIVRGFLDVFGSWDPRLMGVMIGAISIHALAFHLTMKRNSPVLETSFQLPTRKDIDKRLTLGATIFGLGWGWAGICPGPGLVALLSGDMRFILFVGSLLVGMVTFQLVDRKFLSVR